MKYLITAILFLLPMCSFGQTKELPDQPDYPQDYFRNPLDIPIFLAGNFGECRPGHFHSGVDIKTLGKENQPVHAAADGYISRIKMDKTGFGHGLYITHPNGYTTLYAHLNDFTPAIQRYLKNEQYEKKHWDIDIQLTPDQFPVKKGQLIAYSGNTGASTAPHLHFEIRNTKTEHPLNPELFGLPIIDKTPPLPAEVVIYDLNSGHGFYSHNRYVFNVTKKGKTYQLADVKVNDASPFSAYHVIHDTIIFINGHRDISIGINVDDHMDGSDNTLAFYSAKLYLDDSLQVEIKLDDIGYDLSRYVNAYADYKIKQQDNKWVQSFFKLPGNHLDQIYSFLNSNNGKLYWRDTATHRISIVITDDQDNRSEILFYIRFELSKYDIIEDFPAAKKFSPNEINDYNGNQMCFSLSSNALYDEVFFTPRTTKFDSGYSDKHKVLESYIPVHSYFDLTIKPNSYISLSLTNKIVMMYSDGKDEDGRAAAVTDSGWYRAKVRNFGTYWLDVDTTPPAIKSEQKNGANLSKVKQIIFEVKDNKTSVKKFSGYLDGKWICFEQHDDLFFYKFDEHCAKGKHQLVFTAEDENGNSSDYHLTFTR